MFHIPFDDVAGAAQVCDATGDEQGFKNCNKMFQVPFKCLAQIKRKSANVPGK
jgi:hypothetical protein